jgi:hypothetical protein
MEMVKLEINAQTRVNVASMPKRWRIMMQRVMRAVKTNHHKIHNQEITNHPIRMRGETRNDAIQDAIGIKLTHLPRDGYLDVF